MQHARDRKNVFKVLLAKSDEKRSFGRPNRKVEYNIKLNVK
jgi:hypothetical protein